MNRVLRAVAIGVLTTCVTGLMAPGTVVADPAVDRDAAVIVRWNEVTQQTLIERGVAVPMQALYYAMTSLAMYDAVVAIEGGYTPWAPQPRARANASPEAAAATAAYRVLRHTFPDSAANLDEEYAAAMATIRPGAGRVHGIRAGQAAADAMIHRRADDGRDAAVPQPGDGSPEAGEWRPTPPALLPMVGTWLGFVDTFVLPSATTFTLAGPPALTSELYAQEVAEVRDYGAAEDLPSLRTAEQTATAKFWSANPVLQYHLAMRDQVVARGLDIVEAARAFAFYDATTADATIACWRAKYDVNFWRPITAIQRADEDGNPATVADPGWRTLRNTPPYPDYPSGHACLTGATTGVLEHLFGSTLSPGFDVPSTVEGVNPRSFTSLAALDTQTMDARVWLGFHFRSAMTDGNALGHDVATHAATTAFLPVD